MINPFKSFGKQKLALSGDDRLLRVNGNKCLGNKWDTETSKHPALFQTELNSRLNL